MATDNTTTTKTTIESKEEISRDNERASYQMRQDHQQPKSVKCPRCDSMNTKFCYYNNYNLTQPRHFCKTCRRYWTKGGALRNVPIGGGCRKRKKLKSSSSNSSIDSSTSVHLGGLKFFHGLSSSPAMDFQFGGLSLPRLNLNSSPSSGTINNQFFNSIENIESSFLATPNSFTLDPYLGFNFSFPSLFNMKEYNISQASDLPSMEHHQHIERPQPIMFQNLDILTRTNVISYDNARQEGQYGNLATEYLFEEAYAPTTNATTTITSSANNWNEKEISWNNAVQAWGNLGQFNATP